MCLSSSPQNSEVKINKDLWYRHICLATEEPNSHEGLQKAHHEEEEEEEEEEMRSSSLLSHRNVWSIELVMHTSDDCILTLPSLEELTHTLISCKKEKDRGFALHLHAYLTSCGLEAHGFLGNFLVPLLVEAVSIAYAQHAFDRLLFTNECAWNYLIMGYLKSADLEHAYTLYQKMQRDDSLHVSSITLVALLKTCAKSKDLVKGSIIHSHVVTLNLESDLFVGSALVDMYAKCGLLIKALEVSGKILDRDVVAWTALLAGYVEHGQSEEALQLFEQMQLEGVFPDAVTLVSNLKACASVGAIQKGRELHTKAACTGFLEKDIFLGSTLVDVYTKFKALALAYQVFDNLPIRDVVSWTSLITGYVEHGQSEEAMKCLEQMQSEGALADAITFVCTLKASGLTGLIHKVRQIHAKIATTGLLKSDSVIANTLVDVYGRCGSLSEAKQLFERLSERDVVSWTVLIAAHVEHNLSEEALEYLEHMQLEGILPNAVAFVCSLKACSSIKAVDKAQAIHTEVELRGLSYHDNLGTALVNTYANCGLLGSAQQMFDVLPVRDVVSWTALVSGYAEHDCVEQALKYFKEMQSEGITPSSITFLCILKACASLEPLAEIHAEIERKSLLDGDTLIGTTLVDMYAKCGLIARAQEVFDNLQARDSISWNALIAAYVDGGCSEKALECYECMHDEGIFPDLVTIICSLKACGNIGAVGVGREIHCEAERRGLLESGFAVGTSLVGMYSKLGLFLRALEVLEELPVLSVDSWNSLFLGYVEHGRVEEAIMCLEQMELDGMLPNFDTFLCSLKACGNIDYGRKFVGDGGWGGFVGKVLTEKPSSYTNCNRDLLNVACQVFDKLPIQDVSARNALITGHFTHGCYEEGLNCFEQMQSRGVALNVVTLVCALKACSCIGALQKGQEIHVEIERKGLINEYIAIGNTLVHMYAKCGNLAIAHQVLDSLPVRDVVSWTALISGYAEHQLGEGALKCLARMQLEGVSPDMVTFVSSIRACGSIVNATRGEEIHAEVERKGLLNRDNPVVGTALVAMYSQHGMLSKAQEVLETLPERGIFAWTVLMAGYMESGLSKRALDCFERMQLDGVSPDVVAFVCVLKACAKEGDLEKGREMHSRIEAMGISKCDLTLETTMIDMYAKCGSFDAAHQLFDRLQVQDVVSWTALLAGYAEQGHAKEALDCLQQMQVEGFLPNAVTFTCIIRTCAKIGALSSGQALHADVQRRGLLEVGCVAEALVDMYAKFGCCEMAKSLFYQLPFRDRALWSSLIGGLAEHGHGEEALACLDQMQLEGGFLDDALSVCSLKACSSIGSIEKGQELHSEIERVGLLKDLLVGTTLLDMYVKCGTLVKAQEVFDKLSNQDAVSWTALIAGYTHYGYSEEALECFEQMQIKGLSPDPVTLICILKACSGTGALNKGQEIHLDIERKGFLGEDLAIGNTLINMYAKNGSLPLAMKVFDNLQVRDTVSWNSITAGYAQLGDSINVFKNLEKMLLEGVKPDPVTFKIIFGVCCRAGLSHEMQLHFDAMSNEYGMIPSLEHLIGIVDLLCHLGHTDEAIIMVEKMPVTSNLVLWNRVLEACRYCGLFELGKQAFERTFPINKAQVHANRYLTCMLPPRNEETFFEHCW